MGESDRQRERKQKKKVVSLEYHGGDVDVRSNADDDDEAAERRLRRQMRRAKKMAKHLERLGLDENEDKPGYPVREYKFTIPGMSDQVVINPVVALISIAWLWGIVLWCGCKSILTPTIIFLREGSSRI
jgi:hypothetical protein